LVFRGPTQPQNMGQPFDRDPTTLQPTTHIDTDSCTGHPYWVTFARPALNVQAPLPAVDCPPTACRLRRCFPASSCSSLPMTFSSALAVERLPPAALRVQELSEN
jgi:hypothetical protein